MFVQTLVEPRRVDGLISFRIPHKDPAMTSGIPRYRTMANVKGNRPALSPALTKHARELQAQTPDFVPLKPGKHRSIDDYTFNHYFNLPKKLGRRKRESLTIKVAEARQLSRVDLIHIDSAFRMAVFSGLA
jgi:hypothetical protein